jgi:propionyl-CoA synthetase
MPRLKLYASVSCPLTLCNLLPASRCPKPRFLSSVQHSSTSTMPPHKQDEVQKRSLEDPESFWAHHADQLYWHKKPSQTLKRTNKKLPSGNTHQHWTWFPDGEISTSYNCIDRHVKAGRGDSVAIIWDSPVTGTKQKITYKQLLAEVETLAGVLREQGVNKGDVVLLYSKKLRGL